jgi:hypothetical protein
VRSDPALPAVFTRADAGRVGLTRNQVTQRLGNGRWHRLVKGGFCSSSRWQNASPEERHLLLARAVLLTRTTPAEQVFSHVTAAVLHGLPISAETLATVWMTAVPGHGHNTRYGPLRREVAELRPEHLVTARGLRTTNLARTTADCLRHLPVHESVPLTDAALRRDLTREELLHVLGGQSRWPYAAAAMQALDFVDPRRETVLESRSGIVMQVHEVPRPVPQAEIYDLDGDFVGRVDFWWPQYGVVGEADGAAKYRDGDPVAVFRREKDRQARLEALGLIVVRWDWRHLFGDPPELVTRVVRALDDGDPQRFRGRAA